MFIIRIIRSAGIRIVAPGYETHARICTGIHVLGPGEASDILIIAYIHVLVVRGILACKIPSPVHVFFGDHERMAGAIAYVLGPQGTAAKDDALAILDPRVKYTARHGLAV